MVTTGRGGPQASPNRIRRGRISCLIHRGAERGYNDEKESAVTLPVAGADRRRASGGQCRYAGQRFRRAGHQRRHAAKPAVAAAAAAGVARSEARRRQPAAQSGRDPGGDRRLYPAGRSRFAGSDAEQPRQEQFAVRAERAGAGRASAPGGILPRAAISRISRRGRCPPIVSKAR
ncbi:Uncharacterised protein [Serratia marcescens]|uniref:Uncharacterized protein n=1 Tax=Serratia marcescens TaxID=615 RepID=A0A379YEA5_SERMA|nr:Uncharacterised protein [Serratia marcescens]